ncbi:formate hydrogenlyase subunit 4 [Candidatus Velamenicoccus archaeovorus]|uniref:Formate hydrogenlyase subunit 4 n=1 Tax=Velamenicoccus archaeovorus TaxID=1930593 RepID=A0A410P6Q3_VELA1|nr:NADH-quinone oxidoreductase subunit H [Candidatus Velamenicoccus archaeovorus]QAT17782.1 formate hydrogenlyase subunit 4 [Candidatus Velamenicoccus archaeovorus]
MKIPLLLLQAGIAVLAAPLVSGFVRRVKNALRMRQGAALVQPYRNIAKYMRKEEVVSETASWIFRWTPSVVLGSTLAALMFVPVFSFSLSAAGMGDVLSLFFLFSLGRFFLALAGLDAGSAFGGMGSSREMFIASFVEPAAVLAVAVVAAHSSSSAAEPLVRSMGMSFSGMIAAASLFMVVLAETSRIPVDNQETHLELTMIHEAMLLEYSGPSLAMLETAAHAKQLIWFSLLGAILWPWPIGSSSGLSAVACAAFFVLKIILCAIVVGLTEIGLAKMRLFRVTDFLGLAFLFSVLALVVSGLGY